MPLYEYCCIGCNASEERLCSYSSPTEYDCPVCGRVAGMQRQISVPSIAFSGGGWYAEGYSNSLPSKGDKVSDGDSAKSPSSAGSNAVPSDSGCCGNCPHRQ